MAWNDLTVPTDDATEFQRILNTAYKHYQANIENLTDAATDEIETAVTRGDLDLKEVVRDYTASAAQLSKDYYHVLRQTWQEYTGEVFPGFSDDGLVDPDLVLWQTQHGFAGTDWNGVKYSDVKNGTNKAGLTMDDLWPSMSSVDDAQQFIADMIRNALRAQTRQSMRRDPTRPRWARVPQGKTCAFCVMLASRGFAYTSEEAAGGEGNAFHDDCDCRIIPTWGSQTLTGYDPERYYAMYQEGKAAAGDNGGYREALRELRRLHPDDVSDGVTAKPAVRWEGAVRAVSNDELRRLSDYAARMPGDKYGERTKTNALRDWTGTAYKRINAYCFGDVKLTDDVAAMIARLDEAIGDHITQQTFTVDRQMLPATFKIPSNKDWASLVPGTVFDHAGYMACSTDLGGKDVGDDGRIAVRILVPSGNNAVYLEPITHVPGEREVLLPRGRKLEYVGAGTLDDDTPILYCRLV